MLHGPNAGNIEKSAKATEKSENCAASGGKEWLVEVSCTAKNCKNYIRDVVDNLDLEPNPEKAVIAFSIGDPTVYGNLKPSQQTTEALVAALQSNRFHGYAPCVGYEASRLAVANYLSYDRHQFHANDIILCSGCSSALEIAITALADARRENNILVPRPGFSIYRTLAEAIGVSVRFYNLLKHNNWMIDLEHLESLIDSNTAVIVLNNPSNPCGSVYDEEHLRDLLEIARRHNLPVIADEIYERLVFQPKQFISTASIKAPVPILICGGLAKRFLVPGWRLGWIAVYDEIGAFVDVRRALQSLSQRIIGSNTVVQGALDGILATPKTFHDGLIATLNEHATIAFKMLQNAKGLTPYMPEGTMYMLIEVQMDRFPFDSVTDFVTQLMGEESVFCLPGECFQISNFMRIVLTVPEDLMREGCQRIIDFCKHHCT